jgi:hypothetical protein
MNDHVFAQMVRFGSDILAVGSLLRCRRCLAMAFAITYNCVFSQKEEETTTITKTSESESISTSISSISTYPTRSDDRLQRLLGDESTCILRPLLLAIVDIPLDNTKPDNNSEDPALEW